MQFFKGKFVQTSTGYSAVNTTPPSFAGVSSLVQRSNGSLRASWSAATDELSGIRYNIYIKQSNDTSLFDPANYLATTTNLQYDIYNLSNDTNLLKDQVYYVGVRATDASNNTETNTVSLNEVSLGVADNSLFNLLTIINNKIGTPILTDLVGDIYSRLATSSYVAPNNSLLTTIDLKLNTALTGIDTLPLLGEIEASTVLAKEATVTSVKSKTDNLPSDPASNTQVNTRLSAAAYTAPDNASVSLIKAKTDNLPVDPASNTQVNTRLASASYTAPDNASITDIKNKTDQLTFTSGNVHSDAKIVTDKSDYEITTLEKDDIALKTRTEIERTTGKLQAVKNNTDLIPATV